MTSPASRLTRTLARWLALAALGPITGPLVAGLARNRARPILATLYLAAIPSAWLLLAITAKAVAPH